MNRPACIGGNRPRFVDRLTEYVHDPAQRRGAYRHLDRFTGIANFHTAFQPFRRTHRNGTNHTIAQLLLDLECQPLLVHQQRVIYVGQRVFRELNVHHRTDNLYCLS